MGRVRLPDQRPRRKPGVRVPPIPDHVRPSVKEEHDVPRLVPGAGHARVPCPADVDGLDLRVGGGAASIQLFTRGGERDEAPLFVAGRKRGRDVDLDEGEIVQHGADDADAQSLAKGPAGVLAERGDEEPNEPEGQAGRVEGDGEDGEDGLARLEGDEGVQCHLVPAAQRR